VRERKSVVIRRLRGELFELLGERAIAPLGPDDLDRDARRKKCTVRDDYVPTDELLESRSIDRSPVERLIFAASPRGFTRFLLNGFTPS